MEKKRKEEKKKTKIKIYKRWNIRKTNPYSNTTSTTDEIELIQKKKH